jgi:tetratricopeptide (TPR) repeat protein
MTTSAQDHSVALSGNARDVFNIHVEEKHILESAPQTPPQVPHLHRLIGREDEKQTLLNLYERVKRTGRGATVFLMGQQGSGCHALTGWMHKQVLEQGDAAAAARFWDPDLVPAGQAKDIYWENPAMEAYGPTIAETFHATSEEIAGAPWVSLAAQMAQQMDMILDLPHWPDDPRSLNQFVRWTARRKSLFLTLENLEWADPIWIDLLRRMVDEVALDLPAMLLITLTSSASLDELSDDQHTEPTRLVETLVGEGVARHYYLEPITTGQFVDHLEPIESELGQRLRYLAPDDVLVAEMIWEEWKGRGAIFQDEAGTWQVDPAQDGDWWVYGDIRDHAHDLLKQCLGASSPFDENETGRILNCAAVEGSTFTAAAVAGVMDVDPDTLIDFFDDCLITGEGQGMEDRANGLLVDLGAANVSDRALWLYGFARPYLHHVWAKYPALENQRKAWSRQLAEELEQLYYPETSQIASKLIELFEAGGAPRRARVYRKRRMDRSSLATLRWHVQFLAETVPDDDRFGTYRLFDRGFALLGRLVKERPDLWEEGVWLAQELARRAEWWADKGYRARAYRYMAGHYYNAGRYREALPWAQRAVALYRERYGAESTEIARGLNELGMVQKAQGDLEGARASFERVLDILDKTLPPEHPYVAATTNNLGMVQKAQGDLEGARASLERALRIDEAAFGPDHPNVATEVNHLGLVQQAQGDLEGARASYERALRVDEAAYGPHHPNVARDVNNLGMVQKAQGDLEGARASLERALRILENSQLPLDHPYIEITKGNLESLG